MSTNENERPVASGLDAVFGIYADKPDTQRGQITEQEKSDSENVGQKENGESREGGEGKKNRHPRHRRRNRSKNRDNVEVKAEETDAYEQKVPEADLVGMNDDVPAGEYELTTSSDPTCEIIGIRFKNVGKVYYFAPGDIKLKKGDSAIVETARGLEYGFVSLGNTFVPASEIVAPLRNVIRQATEEDSLRYEENLRREKEAFTTCLEKIRKHGLEMKLIDAEYTFDQSKLTFYFSADGRVDFRELVKDLASVFRTRIELRQIGIRDEAKLVGGLGVCGRPFCCTTFLSDFVQVSIKMAKEQCISLNSAKISGACGRLMCCLRYEHETYEEEIKKTPSNGSRVKTSDGVGVVVDTSPLLGKIKVKIGDEQNPVIREFHRDDVTVLPKNKD